MPDSTIVPIFTGICTIMSFALPMLSKTIFEVIGRGSESSPIDVFTERGAFKWACIAVFIGLVGLACAAVPYAVMLTSTSYNYEFWVFILSVAYFILVVCLFIED